MGDAFIHHGGGVCWPSGSGSATIVAMSGFITNRRRVLGGLALGLAMPALITSARAAQPIDAAAVAALREKKETSAQVSAGREKLKAAGAK